MISDYEPPLKGLARLGYVVPRESTPLHDAITTFLDRLYRIPDPNETIEEFDRYYHYDLVGMPLLELKREARNVQRRLDLDDHPATWLSQRLDAVRQAIRGYSAGTTQEPAVPTRSPQQTRGISLEVRRIASEARHD